MVYCNETSDGAMYINFGVTIGNEDGSSRSVEHCAKMLIDGQGVKYKFDIEGSDYMISKKLIYGLEVRVDQSMES